MECKNELFFSFVVPVYNIEEYIEECINSIEEQDIMNYEVILINDGSTDNSGKICDKIKEKYSNIRVVHKKNGGLSDARNTGLRIAKGKYILFVDGDDYIQKNVLRTIYDKIVEAEMPDIVALECNKVFENKLEPMNDGIDKNINDLKDHDIYMYLSKLNKYPASACTKAINREYLLANKLFFKEGILSEDLEWAGRLFANVKHIIYVDGDYYFYRQAREGSISNTPSEKKTLDILNTMETMKNLAEEYETNYEKKIMIHSFMEYIFRFLILGYYNVKYKKKYKENIEKFDFVLGTRKDRVSMIISNSYKILGIKITAFLLKGYLKIRK